jgi:HEAT repeat protein
MKYIAIFIFLFFISSIYGKTEKEYIQRIDNHILIQDYESALEEAKNALKFKNSSSLKTKYIYTLALNNDDLAAIQELKKIYKNDTSFLKDHDFLEALSWEIINKGSKSIQFQTRLTALIGAYLAHDVKGVQIINKSLKDTNAVIRSISLQLASSYMDEPLKNEVRKLINSEKLWLVKLEVIKAIGQMKIEDQENKLEEILSSNNSTYEEKTLAIKAYVNIFNDISLDKIKTLSKSNKASLRELSLILIDHFKIKEANDIALSLLEDPISDVRIAALNAILSVDKIDNKTLHSKLKKASQDVDYKVAITACYIAILKDFDFGKDKLKDFFKSNSLEIKRLAASAVSRSINKCKNLAYEILKKEDDKFVKANIAIGFIGNRENIKNSLDIIYDLLESDKQMWMIDSSKNPIFEILTPSIIRHVDHIPNYPEAIDQMTRLNLLSMLCILEDIRSIDAIKSFLKKQSWGITGFAAATLLKEGDEKALDSVKNALNDDDHVVKVQSALVLALLGKDPSVIDILEDAYKSSDHEMKIHILEAIAHIGSKKSIKFLVNTLEEPFQILRVIAASALIQCINS